MAFFLDPSFWVGLLTLVLLEIILGLDNLLFIAILVAKLPPTQRDKARILGLISALCMRLVLLFTFSHLLKMQTIVIKNYFFSISSRSLILLVGGIFLLFKATMELHERIGAKEKNPASKKKNYASFWIVVLQIIILDAIFSLDSIITALGMVNKLFVMIASIIIATSIMLLISKELTKFINLHQTVVVLCLSFLLIVGLSLIAESFGFFIPKEYLYAAVTFSIFIEFINQMSHRNLMKHQNRIPLRERTASMVLRFISRQSKFRPNLKKKNNQYILLEKPDAALDAFQDEEKYMITAVLTLSGRSIRSMMTPRGDISWVNANHSNTEIKSQLLKSPHSLFPVCQGELDEIIGVVRAKELLVTIEENNDIVEFAKKIPPIIIPDTIDPINLLNLLRTARGNFVIVTNEFGIVQGLVTPLDILEAIAGEFPDADETPDIIFEGNNSWLVKGSTDLHSLEQHLKNDLFLNKNKIFTSLAGLLIAQKGRLPVTGEVIHISPFSFHIIAATTYRINLVRIIKNNF
ncbi:UPF0053 inner membrane protein YoaE [Buchnera aphidicola (Thelaxes suberi)]|uniref:TerC family protein n=1 Tax=Buchnera aphidicola TaxID=9 RepID=UPI0034641116